MDQDQELLDRFAIAAMPEVLRVARDSGQPLVAPATADACWSIAIAMKQARDRIFTTAKPAADHVPPFPPIDTTAIPEKPSVIAAKRLKYEPFEYVERS